MTEPQPDRPDNSRLPNWPAAETPQEEEASETPSVAEEPSSLESGTPAASEKPAPLELEAAPEAADSTHIGRDGIFVTGKGTAKIVNLHVDNSEAIDDLRGIFGDATNQESPEVEVEDLLSPPERNEHLEALEEHRLLVLTSTRRTGLSTAARLRCREFADREGIPAKQLQATSWRELAQELDIVEAPTALVLDASRNPRLAKKLSSNDDLLQGMLKRRECHLVIALDNDQRHDMKERFAESVFALKRIDPQQVFDHHFRRPETGFARLRASEYFAETLDNAWPPLARLMAETLNEASEDLTVEEFQAQMRNRLGDMSEHLRHLLEKQLDATGRAVLISAAVLELASSKTIALASDKLLEETRGEGPTDLLAEYGIAQKLELIQADFHVDGSHFAIVEFGDEVLVHIWNEYPAWRLPIRRWLVTLLGAPADLDYTENVKLPRRLVLFASAAQDGRMLVLQAMRMILSPSPLIRSFAPGVLLGGALTDAIGSSVRSYLYEWSRSGRIALQQVALAVCRDEDYLVRFPRSALYRLRLLAKAGNEEIREYAYEAMVEAATRMHLAELLGHFSLWLAEAPDDDREDGQDDELEDARSNDAPMIARLLDDVCHRSEVLDGLTDRPRLILDDPFDTIVPFWRLLFNTAGPLAVRLAVRAWLSAAAELSMPERIPMADLLHAAARDDYAAIGQLAQAANSLVTGVDPADAVHGLSRRILNRLFEIEVPLQ